MTTAKPKPTRGARKPGPGKKAAGPKSAGKKSAGKTSAGQKAAGKKPGGKPTKKIPAKKGAALPSVASRLPRLAPGAVEIARRKFVEGIVARGEAVPQGAPLTPKATHEIVGHDAQGHPILKRKRFSLR